MNKTESITKLWDFDPKQATENIILDIKTWFDTKFPSGNAVIGISGGKDSTVTAKLLCDAIGSDRVIGVLMPNGVQKDIDDSIRVCELLGIKTMNINIQLPYDGILASLSEYTDPSEQTKQNLAPRLRMTTLFAVAQSLNAVVINTSNYSEYMIGWFTFGSDTCGSYAPILDYTCTEVIEIGRYLGLPEELIEKVPSDGLCGASDEEMFGFSYEDLDIVLRLPQIRDVDTYEKYQIDNDELLMKIYNRMESTHFKRMFIEYSSNPRTFGPNESWRRTFAPLLRSYTLTTKPPYAI